MGEEYGETAPFLYFIGHGDEGLIEAVRQGRKSEFAAFGWTDVPDPYAQATFDQSRLQWTSKKSKEQDFLLKWYQALITLRKTNPALGPGQKSNELKVQAHAKAKVLTIHRTNQSGPEALLILSVNKKPASLAIKNPTGHWHLLLDSNSQEYGGSNELPAPQNFTLPKETLSFDLPPYAVWIYTGG
jgi:maltooligosyltrehalose trehalohydrolase